MDPISRHKVGIGTICGLSGNKIVKRTILEIMWLLNLGGLYARSHCYCCPLDDGLWQSTNYNLGAIVFSSRKFLKLVSIVITLGA
jgi:hypothetical protein